MTVSGANAWSAAVGLKLSFQVREHVGLLRRPTRRRPTPPTSPALHSGGRGGVAHHERGHCVQGARSVSSSRCPPPRSLGLQGALDGPQPQLRYTTCSGTSLLFCKLPEHGCANTWSKDICDQTPHPVRSSRHHRPSPSSSPCLDPPQVQVTGQGTWERRRGRGRLIPQAFPLTCRRAQTLPRPPLTTQTLASAPLPRPPAAVPHPTRPAPATTEPPQPGQGVGE